MIYQHKKGATLSLAGVITATAGETIPDFTGTAVSSQIRMLNDTLVDTLDAVWLDVTTRSVKVYKKDTTAWPVGVAEIDIKFTNPADEVLFTSTQPVNIVKGVTHA